MSLLQPADWTFPVPIAFGPGRIGELGAHCLQVGATRPLVVTDRNSVDLPFIGRALASLSASGITGDVFADVAPNPTEADVTRGREAFRSGGHDCIVAIGGGSGMDAGKAISLVAANDAELWRFDYDHGSWPDLQQPDDLVPLLTVPTTAGTGAETESTAMITNLARGTKACVWHPHQKPRVAILDPELTVGLPPNLTAWTGVDALVHAIEAFSITDWHPMCDGIALEAMRLISRHLTRAVTDGEDLEARSGMLVGSCLGGVSFLKGLGLVHAMSHMIGAVYDTHHGLTNAVLLPTVLQFNREVIDHKIEPIGQALGIENPTFDRVYGWVVDLLAELSIPTRLSDIGVGDDRIEELARKSAGDAAAGTNPRIASTDQIAELIEQALVGTR